MGREGEEEVVEEEVVEEEEDIPFNWSSQLNAESTLFTRTV